MPIAKKELGSPAATGGVVSSPPVVSTGPAVSYGSSKELGMSRCNAMNNTFGAGWFKDYAQTVPLEDAVKKAFEVAGQIEAWLTR